MNFKILFCIFAVSVTLVASQPPPSVACGAVCNTTSQCPATCSVCAPSKDGDPTLYCKPDCNQTCSSNAECYGPFKPCGGCVSGMCQEVPPPTPPPVACGAVCKTALDCPATCSVCAPTGPNSSLICMSACNQTCKTSADCYGPYNGGCGNCVNGKCTTGKECGTACMQDAECGTYAAPYCTKCTAGKCNGACGTKCIWFGNCDASSACPRCVFDTPKSGTCGAPQSCGGQCTVDQDCPAKSPSQPNNCWACVNKVCTKPAVLVSEP